ncbi:MAG: Gfo/Idh/MocA family oxidoreductase, partial [Pseudomonadota bacterium]
MRLLIAGLGQIGARHAAHAASMEGIELVGVIDPDQSLAQPGWGQWFPDLEAVDLAADGLLVATPNPLHPGLAEAAMERGLHVLVEKPLANTLEECDRIVAAAERTGKQVLVGHHRRHHATVAAMKAMLEGGAIGQTVSA